MKLYHSLKFRFTLLFALFIVVLCTIMSFVAIRSSVDMASEVFANQGIAIIKIAAKYIDGDGFKALLKNPDMEDPYFVETQSELLSLKDHSGAIYLYTMAPVKDNIYMFVIDGSGPIGDSEEFSFLGDEEDVSDYDEAFMRCWKTGSITAGAPVDQGEWGWLVSIYAPIFTSSGEMTGIIGCDFDAAHLMRNIRMTIIHQILLGLGFLILGFIIMLIFLRMIFHPLKSIDAILREIASGEGDLTRRIAISQKNEIGELAECFNLTMEKISALIIAIKAQTTNLFSVGNELAVNMDQSATSVNQIAAGVQNINKKIIKQSASVSETGATMEQITLNIKKLNNNVEDQVSSVSQSSAAIEQMLSDIHNVTQTLINNAKNVDELIAASEEGREGLREVSQDIGDISKESEGLLGINSVMKTIASQTNLLSMNAAIEAAHAGEAGQGFAVVAYEIRKLAESSGEQSKNIAVVLKKIKNNIDIISTSTGAALEKFQAINDRIRLVSEQESKIRDSMEKQGAESRRILEAVNNLNELSAKVKQSSVEMLNGSHEVIEESGRLETVTYEITGDINEMSASAGDINAAVNRVKEISVTNKKYIDALAAEVAKFKVE